MQAMNDFILHRATPDDRLPLYRMLELYQHDLSDIWDQELDAHGEYGYALDRYWQNPLCHAFIAHVGGNYAGFALVDGAVKVGADGYWMDQFFILKKYRRHGVGAALASGVFDQLPGKWEVGQMTCNHAAQAFWRRIIGQYTEKTAQTLTEHRLAGGRWEGVVQCFESVPSC